MTPSTVLLTEGVEALSEAKTAVNYLRYKPEDVVAVLDSAAEHATVQEALGFGGDVPIVPTLDEAGPATRLVVGVAPSGGRLPEAMRKHVLDAIGRGMTIVSGLHNFLADDPEFAEAARKHGAELVDVRRNTERDVSQRKGIRHECLRVHTVGHDCNVGKMLVSVELTKALKEQGHSAKFVATGQTGIILEGDGCPIDSTVVDFINGAAEKLVLKNQHHDVLLVEGQGSLTHPRYSAVTLGLLHGCMPDALIMCYELGRDRIFDMDFPLPPLRELIPLYERVANLMHPCRVIGVAMNSRKATAAEADREKERLRAELGLPVCDVVRHGPTELIDAILRRKAEVGK